MRYCENGVRVRLPSISSHKTVIKRAARPTYLPSEGGKKKEVNMSGTWLLQNLLRLRETMLSRCVG